MTEMGDREDSQVRSTTMGSNGYEAFCDAGCDEQRGDGRAGCKWLDFRASLCWTVRAAQGYEIAE